MPTMKIIAGIIHFCCPNFESAVATTKTKVHWIAFTALNIRPAFLLSGESASAAWASRFCRNFRSEAKNSSEVPVTVSVKGLLDAIRRDRTARLYAEGSSGFLTDAMVELPKTDAPLDEHEIQDELLRMMFTCCPHPCRSPFPLRFVLAGGVRTPAPARPQGALSALQWRIPWGVA